MSKTKRKRYSAEFTVKVTMEALKNEKTVSELASQFGIHANMITRWKKHAKDQMATVFQTKAERSECIDETLLKDLHEKIGQLTVERDFLAKAFGR
ncbi:MAG: transposase [Nitrospinota bacterium]